MSSRKDKMRALGVLYAAPFAAAFAWYVWTSDSDRTATARPVMYEERVSMGTDFWGCKKLDDLDKVIDFGGIKKDKAAAASYGYAHCIWLAEGGEYWAENASLLSNGVCLLRKTELSVSPSQASGKSPAAKRIIKN